jgi:hypothetical protein
VYRWAGIVWVAVGRLGWAREINRAPMAPKDRLRAVVTRTEGGFAAAICGWFRACDLLNQCDTTISHEIEFVLEDFLPRTTRTIFYEALVIVCGTVFRRCPCR